MYKELSNKQYNIVIGLILLWGFAVNAIMSAFFPHMFAAWNPTAVLIGYFVIAIAGICMSEFSDNPIISFIGYNLVVLPVGVVLSISLQDYLMSTIVETFILTTLITLLMIVISSIEPEIFDSMGITLFICLSGVVVIELLMMITGFGTPQWWDWLVSLLFCGYIGYDWSKAQQERKTLDNAVDSAVGLYLDLTSLTYLSDCLAVVMMIKRFLKH